ncbi:hypothetical protein GCM10007216_12450 [Thalassobacillus devorans]|uniref:DUF624 domain-containing protein n=1 Tax=Thalassobacillus devorans TaxID=279813 RepID=A0ABQ1NRD1_9BACI|nr:DUF624 domain-containing protein [Thalassobacillus devorans]NIK28813.1 putative membrane protein YesL [Thalassobacillus devorans]GGC83346.1 hypothetical protein GCM10007216_12450 [Thalassobacillus devorans]
MKPSGFMGGLYVVSEWIMRFSLVNLQWVVFNLPIALLLISMLYVEKTEDLFYLAVPLILLVPVLFFPATTAMFAKTREWVREAEEERESRKYVSYYKENYMTSLLAGFVFVALWGVWLADIYYFSDRNQVIMNLFVVMGILLFIFTVNFFSVSAHYNMKLRGLLRQAFFITVGSPLLFLAVSVTSGIVLYISLYVFPIIIPLFSGSLLAFLAFSAFYRLYLKIIAKKLNP